jgi:outer membrane protein OmpA-like peptidoglycan-associated protein
MQINFKHLPTLLLALSSLVYSQLVFAQAYGGRSAPPPAPDVYETNALSVNDIVELLKPDPHESDKGYAPSGRWVSMAQADLDQCFRLANTAGMGQGAPSKSFAPTATDKFYPVKLNFLNGKYDPDAEGKQAMVTLAQALKRNDLLGRRFMVEGHADTATGTPAQNREVSCLRAVRIRELLLQAHGIAPNRLIPVGYGVDKPLPNVDPKHASNRRVVFRLLPLSP